MLRATYKGLQSADKLIYSLVSFMSFLPAEALAQVGSVSFAVKNIHLASINFISQKFF
jgi:hypothetical protein